MFRRAARFAIGGGVEHEDGCRFSEITAGLDVAWIV